MTEHRPLPTWSDLAGRTPLLELPNLAPKPGIRLFAKLENQNPTGSIKDRIVRRILGAARKRDLAPGRRIVEASTGNTGIALAMLGRHWGHPVSICVPETVYPEIKNLLAAYGAEVHWTREGSGIKAAREEAQRLAQRTGAYFLDQFNAPENVAAHYEGTGAEIVADLDRVDVFVAGIGTGGTITGAGRRIKEANPSCRVIGVEPRLGAHVQGLQSLADGFAPPLLDESVLDGRILVGNRHAVSHARRILSSEGVLAGISSGAVLHAALRVAGRLPRANIVLVFADGAWKYMGSTIWNESGADSSAAEAEASPDDDPFDDILWW